MFGVIWMPTYDRGFQLGLLPERKWDWRTFATSYGLSDRPDHSADL